MGVTFFIFVAHRRTAVKWIVTAAGDSTLRGNEDEVRYRSDGKDLGMRSSPRQAAQRGPLKPQCSADERRILLGITVEPKPGGEINIPGF